MVVDVYNVQLIHLFAFSLSCRVVSIEHCRRRRQGKKLLEIKYFFGKRMLIGFRQVVVCCMFLA
jgi:hypothetical protein